MTILDFFDVYNVDHLAAFDYLNNNGSWPEGFLPDNLEEPISLWRLTLRIKMADAWVKYAIIGKIEGIPSIEGWDKSTKTWVV